MAITYKEHPARDFIDVLLDGRKAGSIRPKGRGFHYMPAGGKLGGDIFATVEAVKASIE